MAVRLEDVARRAEVSIKTVSNVVNNRPNVAPATRARVEAAMAALGYRPNLSARSLRAGRTGMLTLAIPDLTAPYFAEIAHRMITAARSHGFTVLIEETEGMKARETDALTGPTAHLVDGTIISPLALEAADLELVRGSAPLVLLGERLGAEQADHVAVDHIAIDNVAAARDAARHLLRTGRRRLAVIGYQADPAAATSRLRMRGVEEALRESPDAELAGPPAPVVGYTWADGAAATDVYLARDLTPDALVCFNDELAIGAIRRLTELGYRVPRDLAVIGIDDIQLAERVTPTLSSVAPDKDALASAAVVSILERLDGGEGNQGRTGKDVVVPHRVVVRESSRPTAG